MLNVLCINDSAIYRTILTKAVEAGGKAYVKASVLIGQEAIDMIQKESFDVVIIDINRPGMDGAQTLKRIKSIKKELPVVVFISDSVKDTDKWIEEAKEEAFEIIQKPLIESYDKNIKIISQKMDLAFSALMTKCNNTGCRVQADMKTCNSKITPPAKRIDLVLIAVSTGGPLALELVLKEIPSGLNVPILAVQHILPNFTKSMVEAFNRKFALKAYEGANGMDIKPGNVYVAPGGEHMLVKTDNNGGKFIMLEQSPYVQGVRPAADVLFKSVANVYKGACILAVVLTGMGRDGTDGVNALKRNCSCYCITQDEKSCVVYGMPASIVEVGLSDEKLDIMKIGKRIVEIVNMGW